VTGPTPDAPPDPTDAGYPSHDPSEDLLAGDPLLDEVGETSPGRDLAVDPEVEQSGRVAMAGTPTGDLGGADAFDIAQARELGSHEDQS